MGFRTISKMRETEPILNRIEVESRYGWNKNVYWVLEPVGNHTLRTGSHKINIFGLMRILIYWHLKEYSPSIIFHSSQKCVIMIVISLIMRLESYLNDLRFFCKIENFEGKTTGTSTWSWDHLPRSKKMFFQKYFQNPTNVSKIQ